MLSETRSSRKHCLYCNCTSCPQLTGRSTLPDTMLLQKAPTSLHGHRSSSTRRVQQPVVAPRRLVVAEAALKETAAVPVMEKGELSVFPEQPAVYAVYDKDGKVQYIGLTRKVSNSINQLLVQQLGAPGVHTRLMEWRCCQQQQHVFAAEVARHRTLCMDWGLITNLFAPLVPACFVQQWLPHSCPSHWRLLQQHCAS